MLTLLLAVITAGGCRSESFAHKTKLAFCNAALVTATPFHVFPIERDRSSMIRLERGIALAQLERTSDARSDFAAALRFMVNKGQASWLRDEHLRRIARLRGTRTEALWRSVLDGLIADEY
ncbi:hypothetical protein Z946_2282 [Sulfitobacter noctilucicola]|nr:hypothetical protein [Sulfitobacter noctilucicola]KIN63410.1 hypothetical protein Z946_2282 [Sulfitobacter noctilucicola]